MTREEAMAVDMTPPSNSVSQEKAISISLRQNAAKQILNTPKVDWLNCKASSPTHILEWLKLLVEIRQYNNIELAIQDRTQKLFDAIALDTIEKLENILVPETNKYVVTVRHNDVVDRVIEVEGKTVEDIMNQLKLEKNEFVFSIKEMKNA